MNHIISKFALPMLAVLGLSLTVVAQDIKAPAPVQIRAVLHDPVNPIANLPGPALWLDQTDEDARDYSESRLQKLFDQCEPVRRLMPSGIHRHKSKNNAIQ